MHGRVQCGTGSLRPPRRPFLSPDLRLLRARPLSSPLQSPATRPHNNTAGQLTCRPTRTRHRPTHSRQQPLSRQVRAGGSESPPRVLIAALARHHRPGWCSPRSHQVWASWRSSPCPRGQPRLICVLESSRLRKRFFLDNRSVLYVEVTNRLSVFCKVIGGILGGAGTPGWYRLSPHSSLSQSK